MRPVLLVLLGILLALPARAAELKVATWNLEWLTTRAIGDPALPADAHPKRPQDIDQLRHYADVLNADVVAFQEVDGPAVAARVFTPDRYVLHMTQDHVVQRVGLAIRRGIPFTAHPDLTALDPDPEAPQPLRSGADVTLDLPGTTLRLLVVHLKTGCWDRKLYRTHLRACATLREQAWVLKQWIAARRRSDEAFLILGDFNRRMDGHDQFLATLDRVTPLVDASAGYASPCWGGDPFIDHILAGDAAKAWVEPRTLRVLVYRETDPIWKERLSDHCPISVRLRLP